MTKKMPPTALIPLVVGHLRIGERWILVKKYKFNSRTMLTDINPKLPMRNKSTTRHYYINQLGFQEMGDYEGYLMVKKDKIEIHFF